MLLIVLRASSDTITPLVICDAQFIPEVILNTSDAIYYFGVPTSLSCPHVLKLKIGISYISQNAFW